MTRPRQALRERLRLFVTAIVPRLRWLDGVPLGDRQAVHDVIVLAYAGVPRGVRAR